MDATLAPIAEGKIIATLNGSDVFDDGVRVVTQRSRPRPVSPANGPWT